MQVKTQNQNQHLPKQRIPWNIRIQAKAKHFHLNFNFKSSTSLLFFNLNAQPPRSLLLNAKFLKCHLFLSSEFGSSSSSSTKPTIKSKFFKIFRKLMPKKSKNSPFFPQKNAVKLQCRKSLWVGLLAAMLVPFFRYPLRKIIKFDEAGFAEFLGYCQQASMKLVGAELVSTGLNSNIGTLFHKFHVSLLKEMF